MRCSCPRHSPILSTMRRLLVCALVPVALSVFASGCSSDTSSDPEDTDAGVRDGAAESSSDATSQPSSGKNGETCTLERSDCNPACGASCGTSAACLDLCCKTTREQGVLCSGVCTEDRCFIAACEAKQQARGSAWQCLDSENECTCSADPAGGGATGSPSSSCAGPQCLYDVLADSCFCNKQGAGSVIPSERVVPNCNARPSCACDLNCR